MEQINPKQSLPGIFDLIKGTWEVTRDHWKNLFRFSMISVLISFVGAFLVGISSAALMFSIFLIFPQPGSGQEVSWKGLPFLLGSGVVVVLVVLLVVAVLSLAYAAILEALRAIRREGQEIGLKEAFLRAKPRFLKLFWVGILNGLAVIGGLIFLIIPGIIFFIRFIFSSYVYINEDISGSNALRRSSQYVKGKWWSVAGRVIGFGLLLGITTSIISAIIQGISDQMGMISFLLSLVANLTINLFVMTVTLVYGQLLYESVRGTELVDVPITSS